MELYLDNAATTSLDEEAKNKYFELLNNYYGSTGSLHKFGQIPLELETKSRMDIANLLKVHPDEIYFNSGATEGNNLAIKGVAFQYKNRGNTIITTKIEHPSVYECVKQLEKDFHFNCIYLDVDDNGLIDLKQLKNYLSNDVILVSIMYVNHEVGSIMPIKQIRNLINKYPKIIFHSDITQAIGKIDIDFNSLDIATMSAHKIHGLKGSGFLFKKNKVQLFPLINGHPAHNALRAGTSNWPSNVVMSIALRNTLIFKKNNYFILQETQRKLAEQLAKIPEVSVNTSIKYSIPNILNFSLINYNPEVIIRALSNKGIYVSSRSVCSATKKDSISSTLYAMKKDIQICISSIRISFDSPLDEEEINYFIQSLKEVIKETKKVG